MTQDTPRRPPLLPGGDDRAPAVTQPLQPPRLLVVDDEPDIQLVVSARLEAAGYIVETAADGLEALNRVRANPPDLIVLDVMLPGMDGFAVCAMLKRDQRFSRIPVIMLSARTRPQDRSTGTGVGADAYLAKPFQPAELLGEIRRLLQRDGVPADSEART
uniref:Response regulator n=1 Tax=candidate division WOR-3 bacterium TaxID=2052148 RepID=A0A7C4CD69_UNCW3